MDQEIYYAINITIYNNAMHTSRDEANKAAESWVNRLAERDDAHTWDEVDWQVVEVTP